MANTLATPSWVTKEVARGFLNKLVFLAHVNRTYDDSYIQSGAKVGNTVNARLPQRFTVTDGQALPVRAASLPGLGASCAWAGDGKAESESATDSVSPMTFFFMIVLGLLVSLWAGHIMGAM